MALMCLFHAKYFMPMAFLPSLSQLRAVKVTTGPFCAPRPIPRKINYQGNCSLTALHISGFHPRPPSCFFFFLFYFIVYCYCYVSLKKISVNGEIDYVVILLSKNHMIFFLN